MNEKEVLDFWQKNKIFEKSLNISNKDFIFYEGPPSANGRPGIHHCETRAFKDAVCRFKTMTGYRVLRKAGWDTQGLPIENQTAKELELSGKAEIEKYGIEKFNQKCREIVWEYKKEWEEVTQRFGFWLDMQNPYITYEASYIEKLWEVFKKIYSRQIDGQSVVFRDNKVVPHCPSCETTLSSHEVAQGYQDIFENSVYTKFKLVDEDKFFLVWTTTPWTLPGNVALAINENFEYVETIVNNEILILEKSRALKLGFGDIQKIHTGKELIGKKYIPLYSVGVEDQRAFSVYKADFVQNTDGTGIVHIAPAFGEDDFNHGKKNDLPMPQTINSRGVINAEVPGKDKFIKDADLDIIADLKERGLILKEEKIKHTYPFCWRCDGPLVYLLKPSWFIAMSKLREQIKANNEKINWYPEYIKNGRFGNFLEELKDWAISREKSWGTPIPIWVCSKCQDIKVVGSFSELEQLSALKFDKDFDPHRPFVDQIKWKCACGGEFIRTPEVIDVWFDSGAMPYASGEFEQDRFPADFIAEAIDQTRGWFYTLLAISTLLDDGPSYQNVITLGMVVDKSGKKMSKSRGNIVLPMEIMQKYSADSLRWFFYTINQPAEIKKFDEKELLSIERGYLATFKNMLNFYQTYIDLAEEDGKLTILDQWALARVKQTANTVNKYMQNYDLVTSARSLEELAEDLSNWYLRRSRKRINKKFFQNLREILLQFSTLTAPFTPFIAESLYQKLKGEKESVHLTQIKSIDLTEEEDDIIQKMNIIRQAAKDALGLRMSVKIKVRQPLAKYSFYTDQKISQELLDLLADEINVKNIQILSQGTKSVLDTNITEELEKEGILNELNRIIQVFRKNENLQPAQKISIKLGTDFALKESDLENLQKQTATKIILDHKVSENVFKLNDQEISIDKIS